MAQPVHEVEAASNNAASELVPSSEFMKGLGSLVWGQNPPFTTSAPRGEAMDMFQAELATPTGRMNLIKRWGQQKVADIEGELVKAGRVPQQTMTDPTEAMNGGN